ncbi:hypothetical protein V6N13_092732 [Hibiscus sabdariffa]
MNQTPSSARAQGVEGAGGGDKKGIEGKLDNGGKAKLGAVGSKLGKLGSGGRTVAGLGKDGWVVGKVGSVGCGRFGIVGNGGCVGKLGIVGIGGNCWRCRAARLTSMLEKDNAAKKAKMKTLEPAIF